MPGCRAPATWPRTPPRPASAAAAGRRPRRDSGGAAGRPPRPDRRRRTLPGKSRTGPIASVAGVHLQGRPAVRAGSSRTVMRPHRDAVEAVGERVVLREQLADRLVPVDAVDGVGQQRRDRDHLQVRQGLLLRRQRDAVGDDDLLDRARRRSFSTAGPPKRPWVAQTYTFLAPCRLATSTAPDDAPGRRDHVVEDDHRLALDRRRRSGAPASSRWRWSAACPRSRSARRAASGSSAPS